MQDRKKIIIPVVLVLILVGAAGWYWFFGSEPSTDQALEASGTIEAVEVLVAPEQSGRVVEVMVEKGQTVGANEPLLKLDDLLLQSQQQRAQAALDTAKSNLLTAQAGQDMAKASLQAAETNIEAVKASTEVELLSAQQALDELYENHAVAKGEALRAAAASNRGVREAQYQLDNFTVPTNQQNLAALEAVLVMKERLDEARDRFEPYKYKSSSDAVRQDLRESLEEAQSDYDSAVRRLEYETELEKALANQDKALHDLADLEDGPDPDKVVVLEAQINAIKVAPKQAQDAAQQAKVGVDQAQARQEQAATSVSQAQAELDLIQVQMEKLVVYSPITGVVLSRNVEPGEVVQAGAPVMSIGQLENLRITVYVSEDRYGRIKLGGEALMTVDSYPGEVFEAQVVYISDQAEFTPRNVQTQEGRRSTVFAVELSILNEDGKLKPGMPADVIFEE